MLLVAGASEHFHANSVARGDLDGQQIVHSLTDGRTGIAQKLDPGGSVDENHELRWVRISSRLPIQPAPRSFRASSSPSGSAASVRNAKLIASRFVVNWYRRITIAQASSSMSTFVRVIHEQYTISFQAGKIRALRLKALVEATRLLRRRTLGPPEGCDDGWPPLEAREALDTIWTRCVCNSRKLWKIPRVRPIRPGASERAQRRPAGGSTGIRSPHRDSKNRDGHAPVPGVFAVTSASLTDTAYGIHRRAPLAGCGSGDRTFRRPGPAARTTVTCPGLVAPALGLGDARTVLDPPANQ